MHDIGQAANEIHLPVPFTYHFLQLSTSKHAREGRAKVDLTSPKENLRCVGRFHCSTSKAFPVKAIEPGMLFDVCCAPFLDSQPLGGTGNKDALDQVLQLLEGAREGGIIKHIQHISESFW